MNFNVIIIIFSNITKSSTSQNVINRIDKRDIFVSHHIKTTRRRYVIQKKIKIDKTCQIKYKEVAQDNTQKPESVTQSDLTL